MGQFPSRTSSVDEENIRKEVKHFPVVIFTLPRCPYCVRAKQLLNDERIEYKENDLDIHQRRFPANHQSYVNGLMQITKQTSVPQIFICGDFIGGFMELQQLKNAGMLLNRIDECRSSSEKNF
ncbi:glutaredoxin [Onchocerca flexuosa]|uniref:Glutaredoxin n=1 Tax=Onchocerca flexuosa TaxID=387005 RepID=A0A238BP22_9BILA|nr:glutaredoxin [Onchocerca flexuosa]